MDSSRSDEAEQDWRQAVNSYVRVYGRASESSIDTELSLADAFFRRDSLRESITLVPARQSRTTASLERWIAWNTLALSAVFLRCFGSMATIAAPRASAHKSYVISQRMRGPTPIEATAAALSSGRISWRCIGKPRRALDLLSTEVPGDPNVIAVRRWEGRRLLWRGDSYREAGAYAQADDSYDQAIALYTLAPAAAKRCLEHGL